jgi:hypothetical protein
MHICAPFCIALPRQPFSGVQQLRAFESRFAITFATKRKTVSSESKAVVVLISKESMGF